MKTYLISYSFKDARSTGFGNCNAHTDQPLSMNVIRRWEESIKASGYSSVCITNVVSLDE
jgi:hypothetical protein